MASKYSAVSEVQSSATVGHATAAGRTAQEPSRVKEIATGWPNFLYQIPSARILLPVQ